jgi:hypothetical protein
LLIIVCLLLQELIAMRASDASAKALIFSSFQATIEQLQEALPGWGYSFRFINGEVLLLLLLLLADLDHVVHGVWICMCEAADDVGLHITCYDQTAALLQDGRGAVVATCVQVAVRQVELCLPWTVANRGNCCNASSCRPHAHAPAHPCHRGISEGPANHGVHPDAAKVRMLL